MGLYGGVEMCASLEDVQLGPEGLSPVLGRQWSSSTSSIGGSLTLLCEWPFISSPINGLSPSLLTRLTVNEAWLSKARCEEEEGGACRAQALPGSPARLSLFPRQPGLRRQPVYLCPNLSLFLRNQASIRRRY